MSIGLIALITIIVVAVGLPVVLLVTKNKDISDKDIEFGILAIILFIAMVFWLRMLLSWGGCDASAL